MTLPDKLDIIPLLQATKGTSIHAARAQRGAGGCKALSGGGEVIPEPRR